MCDERLALGLRQQRDRLSLMLRYQPDQIAVFLGQRSLLCEVKSEVGRSKNFAIEADSLLGAREWERTGDLVFYAFVDVSVHDLEQSVTGCWLRELAVTMVKVPTTTDWEAHKRRMAEAALTFPGCRIEACNLQRDGSGTPFVLVPKQSRALRPLAELLSARSGDMFAEEPVRWA